GKAAWWLGIIGAIAGILYAVLFVYLLVTARGGRIRGGGAGLPAALLCPGGGPGRLGGRRLGAGVIRAGRRDGQDADGEDEAEGGQEALWAHGSHWSSPLWGAVRRTLRPRPPARTPLAG
ncbi:hypothetical protein HMPREF1550_01176, partial [Actinomyces sp. oral taxon 877 str. F0543]